MLGYLGVVAPELIPSSSFSFSDWWTGISCGKPTWVGGNIIATDGCMSYYKQHPELLGYPNPPIPVAPVTPNMALVTTNDPTAVQDVIDRTAAAQREQVQQFFNSVADNPNNDPNAIPINWGLVGIVALALVGTVLVKSGKRY